MSSSVLTGLRDGGVPPACCDDPGCPPALVRLRLLSPASVEFAAEVNVFPGG